MEVIKPVSARSIEWNAPRLVMAAVILTIMGSSLGHSQYFVYVGSYSDGVHGYRFHAGDGKVENLKILGPVQNPSFAVSDSTHTHLYAVSELEGNATGGVASFAIDPATGALRLMNRVSSAGVAPCHLALDRTGKMLMVANYGTGGVSVFPLKSDGSIGAMSCLMEAHGSSIDKDRQAGPHAHEIVVSADNRLAYVMDLGLDQIRIYDIHADAAKLTPHNPPFAKQEAGFGPRHIVFSADERFAYVVNELKSFVTVFARDAATGDLHSIQNVSTRPEGFSGQDYGPAEILIDELGKYVYASNRGPGSIVVYSVDPSNGHLKMIQTAQTGGTFPRGVEIDPTGHFLFVGDQKANWFELFKIHPQTGQLSPGGVQYNTPSPVSFNFVPAR